MYVKVRGQPQVCPCLLPHFWDKNLFVVHYYVQQVIWPLDLPGILLSSSPISLWNTGIKDARYYVWLYMSSGTLTSSSIWGKYFTHWSISSVPKHAFSTVHIRIPTTMSSSASISLCDYLDLVRVSKIKYVVPTNAGHMSSSQYVWGQWALCWQGRHHWIFTRQCCSSIL